MAGSEDINATAATASESQLSLLIDVLGAVVSDPVAWGVLAIAATTGAMVFFSVCIAPLIFIRLEAQIAARFIRALFPWYYGFGLVATLLAAVLCAGEAPFAAGIALLVSLGFLLSRQALLPAIDAARDAAISHETLARRFDRLHRTSVGINLLQIVLLLIAFAFALHRI